MSTMQLDFQEPVRFEMEYVGADNARHTPIMIHRALFGTVERFFAILLEHYAGNLPTWMSPEQVRVLPVSEDHQVYAESVAARLGEHGVRVAVDAADDSVGARIRRSKLTKVPYILVVGDDDVAAGTVGVNRRGSKGADRDVPVATFLDALLAEIGAHGSPEAAEAPASPGT
jgi:threonyl-tRNA synthetase